MSDRLTYYIGINGEHRWKVQAEGNHEITLDSTEGYVDRCDAEANANRYLTLQPTSDPDVFEVVHAADVRAEALREAADALESEDHPNDQRWTASLLGYHGEGTWLRDRAALAEGGDDA